MSSRASCISVLTQRDKHVEETSKQKNLKCQRLLGPKFCKVKTSFFAEIPQMSNALMPNAGVSIYTPVS